MGDPSDQLEEARAFAQAYCDELGDPGAIDELHLALTGARVTFASLHAVRRGSSHSGFLNPARQRRTLATVLSRIVRGRRRDAAIARAGDGACPPWSMDIHATALTMLCNAGVNPLLLTWHDPASTHPADLLRQELRRSPISMEAEVRAGRICVTAACVRPGYGFDDTIVFYEDESDGTPRLLAPDAARRVVAVDQMPGRELADVIDHPLLCTSDVHAAVTVRSAVVSGGKLLLDMEDARTTLSPPPPGIGTDWLRFAWNA